MDIRQGKEEMSLVERIFDAVYVAVGTAIAKLLTWLFPGKD